MIRDFVNGLLIVSFEESPTQNLDQDKIELHIGSNNNEHLKALENELKLTKERLKANVEEMTTSNEELKSANEELQSLNEESQSTNEELETSKEELQSTNEELSTVNSELQIKIDELSRINDDMINLFNSSQIAIIFVDNDLKIRSFTKESTKLIKLIESDVGRPLSDITMSIKYPDLMDDIKQVTDKLVFKEKEVRTNDDEWYKVRIMPYKTSQNVINGVTITFVNITNLKNTQEKIQSALDYAEDIINTVHEPLVVLDENLKIISANRSFYKTFDLLQSETEGEKLYHVGRGKWNIESLKTLLEDVLPKNKEINNYEFDYVFPKIGHRKMLLNARRIYRGDIGTQLILIALQKYDNLKKI